MTDQDQTNAPTTDTQLAAPATQPDATITPEIQAMIEAAKLSAYNAGAKAARVAEQSRQGKAPTAAQPHPAQPGTQPPPPPGSAPDHNVMRAFDRAMRRFDLPDTALAVVEEDFARANPTDVAGWVTSRASAYGWRTLGTAPTTGTITPPPASGPAPAPPPMPGSTPPVQPVLTNDTPIMSLLHADPSQVARLSEQIGAKKFVERIQSEWRATGLRVKR